MRYRMLDSLRAPVTPLSSTDVSHSETRASKTIGSDLGNDASFAAARSECPGKPTRITSARAFRASKISFGVREGNR